MVGAYGNSWIQTRNLDRLASQSFLFDQAFVDCPQLAAIYRSYWFGVSGAWAAHHEILGSSLPKLLTAAGLHTALVTDERELMSFPGGGDFAEQIVVEPPQASRIAKDESSTQLSRLFAAATAWLE